MKVEIRNGMPAADLGASGWEPWSGMDIDCLEARQLPGGLVALRNSADPASPALIFEPNGTLTPPDRIRAFINGTAADQTE